MARIRWIDRFSEAGSVGKLLGLVVAIYGALSFVQVVRGIAAGGPESYDAGYYAWESDGDGRPFRWTRGATGQMRRRIEAAVLEVPVFVSHPALPADGIEVTLTIGGVVSGRWRPTRNGWLPLEVFVPATAADQVGTRAWVEVTTSAPFAPAQFGADSDPRVLGIGVGEPTWAALADDGIGFYGWESGGPEPFHWTRERASIPVRGEGPFDRLSIWARAAAPASDDDPVILTFFWGADLVKTVELRDNEWRQLPVRLAAEVEDGVLTTRVDRTWNPAVAGVAPDTRELGVALSRPRIR